MTLKQTLKTKFGLSDDNFDSHASDLYVRHREDVFNHLKSLPVIGKNIKTFYSQNNIDPPNTLWIEIPFAYEEFFEKGLSRDNNRER